MKQKLLFLFLITTFTFSCKKANDCKKCIINIVDNSGNIVSTYTKTQFISIEHNSDWCNFVNK